MRNKDSTTDSRYVFNQRDHNSGQLPHSTLNKKMSLRMTYTRHPSNAKIELENQRMIDRRNHFRLAADYVTTALKTVPSVTRICLMGSVSRALYKEVPRFQPYKRYRIEIWHEVKDLDLAVWVSDIDDLNTLRRTVVRGLNNLLNETAIGVAHHEVEVFLLEPGTNRYLGRLCRYNTCPKGKEACRVPGCGTAHFLQQHTDFQLFHDAVRIASDTILFEREE